MSVFWYKNKKLIVLAIICTLLIVSLIIVNNYFKVIGSKNNPKAKVQSNDEILKRTVVWLGKQKDENGIHFSNIICELDSEYKNIKNCDNIQKTGASYHEGLTTMWGNFGYAIKSKDKKVLEDLNKDISNYSKFDYVLQNDFWDCKMMYEMLKSGLFKDETKKQLERICWSSKFYVTSDIDIKSDNSGYQYFLKPNKPSTNDSLIISGLKNNVSYPSEFIARYLWKNDENDLKVAKYYFDSEKILYASDKQYFGIKDICTLGISSIDMYKATNDKPYLEFAELLYKDNLETKNEYNLPVCGLFSQSLHKVTKNKKYQLKQNNIVSNIVKNYYDSMGYAPYFTNNAGFWNVVPGQKTYVKNIRENGLMIYLLSSL